MIDDTPKTWKNAAKIIQRADLPCATCGEQVGFGFLVSVDDPNLRWCIRCHTIGREGMASRFSELTRNPPRSGLELVLPPADTETNITIRHLLAGLNARATRPCECGAFSWCRRSLGNGLHDLFCSHCSATIMITTFGPIPF